MSRRYPNIEAFYAERDARRRSGEVDFGVMWCQETERWPTYRVSWIEETGEFYAIRLASAPGRPKGGVELLGTVVSRAGADAALAGWAHQEPMMLDWVRNRLAADMQPQRTRSQEVAESLEVEGDEDGWHLLVETDQGRYDFRIHGVAYEFAASRGLAALREWHAEGEAARRELAAAPRDVYEDGEPYAPDDPKHPHYRELMAEMADQTRKEARES